MNKEERNMTDKELQKLYADRKSANCQQTTDFFQEPEIDK